MVHLSENLPGADSMFRRGAKAVNPRAAPDSPPSPNRHKGRSGGLFKGLRLKFSSTQNLSTAGLSSGHVGPLPNHPIPRVSPARQPPPPPPPASEDRRSTLPPSETPVVPLSASRAQSLPQSHPGQSGSSSGRLRTGVSHSSHNIALDIVSEPVTSGPTTSFSSDPRGPTPSREIRLESLVAARRLQLTSDSLLLCVELWPLSLHHLGVDDSRDLATFHGVREELMERLNNFGTLLTRLDKKVVAGSRDRVSVESRIDCITRFAEAAVTLMELTYQSVYALSSSHPEWSPGHPGVIDRKTILSAADEVELAIYRLRQAMQPADLTEEDNGSGLLSCCESLSRALTYLAICCRTASCEVISSPGEASQFQLAMRAITAAAQCLLAGVRAQHAQPTSVRRQRVEAFAQAVSASVAALVTMATEPAFVGAPAKLPGAVKMARSALCGSCLTLSSSCIQLLNAIALLSSAWAEDDPSIVQRCSACIQAVIDAIQHFRRTLAMYRTD